MLKILHTADWHIGRTFGLFNEVDSRKLARDRITVIDRILGLAEQYAVDAILCAGDLFDTPDPEKQWWEALSDRFRARSATKRPVVLLPGNHDPINSDSVYAASHPFRHSLPEHVHVVDHSDFQLPLGPGAVVYGSPCTSTAGDRDLAMALPNRAAGDERVRIGLVHGSTFEIEGHSTNFPISREAPRTRGLDYLAVGDAHSWHEIDNGDTAPIVYPGAPEPTSFSEPGAGNVAVVTFRRHGCRPRIHQERVARWTWRDATVTSLVELRNLAASELQSTVLRLTLDMTVSMIELEEVETILNALRGTAAINPRTGAFLCDRSRLRVNVGDWSFEDLAIPDTISATVERLKREADSNSTAKRALLILRRLLHETMQVG